MFEVKEHTNTGYFIKNERENYVHSDGSVYETVEYFPTAAIAQRVLDKFYPTHVWENGDVFLSGFDRHLPLIYMKYTGTGRPPQVFSLDRIIGGPALNIERAMDGAKFLFNIREKMELNFFSILERNFRNMKEKKYKWNSFDIPLNIKCNKQLTDRIRKEQEKFYQKIIEDIKTWIEAYKEELKI